LREKHFPILFSIHSICVYNMKRKKEGATVCLIYKRVLKIKGEGERVE
jgi:hypothetical protein